MLLLAVALFVAPYAGWYAGPGAWAGYWLAVAALAVFLFLVFLAEPSRVEPLDFKLNHSDLP
jgi:hypothetical protein